MAKKKKAKKSRSKSRSRSRRGGMLGAIDVTNTLSIVVGAVGAKLIDKVVPESLDPRIVAAGKVAAGLFLPGLVKDGKTKAMMQGVGSGMIAVGAMDLLTSFGVLSGVSDNDLLAVSLEGVDDLPVVNGTDDLPVVNGDASVLAGDDTQVLAGDPDEYEFY